MTSESRVRELSWAVLLASAMVFACDGPLPLAPADPEDTFGEVDTHWFVKQTLWPKAAPVISGDLVIFGTGDRRLEARERSNGALRWSTTVTSISAATSVGGLRLLVVGNTVVAAVSRNVVGVDRNTGAELWSYLAPRDTVGSGSAGTYGFVGLAGMAADENTVYIPAWGATVSAVDVQTGQAKWTAALSPTSQFRAGAEGATLSGDTLYVNIWWGLSGTLSQTQTGLVALDRETGQELWRVAFPPYSSGTVVRGYPQVWRDLVIVGSNGGRVIAVERGSGNIRWQFAPSEALLHGSETGPVVYGDNVFADASNDYIVSLRASDGSVNWRTLTLGSATSELLVTERRIYAPGGAFLDILNRENGRYVARVRQPHEIQSTDETPYGIIGGLFASSATAVGRQVFISVAFGAWSFLEP